MDGFAFILNISDVSAPLPYEILPGHFLDRATAEQVADIKAELANFRSGSVMWASPHEHDLVPWIQGGSPVESGWMAEPLPQEKWRYFVVNYPRSANRTHEVVRASILTESELWQGLDFLPFLNPDGKRPAGYHADTVFHFLGSDPRRVGEGFVELTESDLRRFAELSADIKQHDDKVVNVSARIGELRSLRLLERSSRLSFLGYFAIIESMLTHKPQPSDPYDSITRQVKSKMALLGNRFKGTIPYAAFGSAKTETVWAKLYAYRSCIAHGGKPDFRAELSVLKDHETALDFIRSVTKSLLVYALKEPELIRDLQQC